VIISIAGFGVLGAAEERNSKRNGASGQDRVNLIGAIRYKPPW